MSEKIVVLGANSFSGQDFIDLLLDETDAEIIGVSRSPERSALFLKYKTRNDLSRYRYYQFDLNRDLDRFLELLDEECPDSMVNFAAQSEVAPSWENPEQWFQTNTVVLAQMINHLRKKNYIRRYLHISSPEVYGNCTGAVLEDAHLNPSTPYAASKAAADMLTRTYFKQFGFPLITVRATNVYGARQQLFKIIPRSVIYLSLNKKIKLHGGGAAVKSYIHIRDISRGELTALKQGEIGQIYHLSPERGISIRDLVRRICEFGGKNFEDAAEIVDERPGQDAAYIIDSTLARKKFGWQPLVTLDQGLSEVIDWVNQYWDEIARHPLEYQHKP